MKTWLIVVLVIGALIGWGWNWYDIGFRISEERLHTIDSMVYKNGQLEIHTTSYKTKYYMYYKDSTLQFIKADKSGKLGFFIKE